MPSPARRSSAGSTGRLAPTRARKASHAAHRRASAAAHAGRFEAAEHAGGA
jgi:hypothetical protein